MFNAPYTPKLNPAEILISLVKKHVRISFYDTVSDLIEAIGRAFTKISTINVINICKHSFKEINFFK